LNIESIQYLVTGEALTIGDDVSYVLELFKKGVSVWATSFDGISNVLNGSIWEAPLLPSGEFVSLDADILVVTAIDIERERQVFRIDGAEFYIPPTGAGVTEEYRFELPPTYTLTISAEGAGITTPAPGQYTYNEGELAIVTAIPNTGFNFLNWLYNGSVYTTNPQALTMYGDVVLQAIFDAPAVEERFPWEIPAAAAATLVIVGALVKGRK